MSGAHCPPDGAPEQEPPAEEHGRRTRRTRGERPAPKHAPESGRRGVSRAGLAAILAGALVLGAAAAASAVFLDRAAAGARVASGTVIAEFDATGATTVPVAVTGLLPGGTARRLLDLTHAGTVPMSALQLTTTAGASASDGVQFALERCSQPWSADAATCGGTVSTVAADRPASARVDLPGSPALTVGATDHLRLTLRLPESAPSDAQGTSTTLTVTVLGVQGPGRHL